MADDHDTIEHRRGLALPRTKAALKAYDELWGDDYDPFQDGTLAVAVGEAFGLDTADRNNQADCKRLIRPGPRKPGPGCELSFVRRMVALPCVIPS